MGLILLAILVAGNVGVNAQTMRDVTVNTNGVLLAPTNFFSANKTNVLGAVVEQKPWLTNTNTPLFLPVGTTAGTVAAGDDARITNAVQRGESVGFATNSTYASQTYNAYFADELIDSDTENVVLSSFGGVWSGDLSGLAAALDATNLAGFAPAVTNALPSWAASANPATVRTNLGLGPLATATNVASPLTISNSLLGVTVGTNGVVGFSFSAPVATNSMGVPGQVFFSTNYLYLCVGSNEWRRVLLGTW